VTTRQFVERWMSEHKDIKMGADTALAMEVAYRFAVMYGEIQDDPS